MKIYDVSMTIEEGMQVYKNKEDKRPRLAITRDFTNSAARESRITMDMHTGTHLDMPLHFHEAGETVESLELDRVVTECRVFDLSHVSDGISADDLIPLAIEEGDFVLLKTRNSAEETFNFRFVYVRADGAAYLKEQGVRGVGIDGLGIERDQPDYATHKTLLKAGILILEGLRLKDVPAGRYLLVAAPLKIKNAEAAPVRALLLEGLQGIMVNTQ